MSENTILLVENNKGTVANQLQGLEALKEKFSFVATDNSAVVENVVDSKMVDVGVFDVRLKDDQDEHDYSGLVLARRVAKQIPTVIFSSPKNYETARNALKWPPMENHPHNVFFVAKNGTGVTKLVETLENQALPKAAASSYRMRAATKSANKPADDPSQLRLMLPVILLVVSLAAAGAALLFGQFFLLAIGVTLTIVAAILMMLTLRETDRQS